MYIQHLVLRVRDIEVAHDFYTRILGFEQCAALEPEKFPEYKMRFYRGDPNRHHDLALAELLDPTSAPPPESPWSMFGRTPGIDHFAVCYPDRESWLNQIAWMQSQGAEFRVRGNHGMTHSAYVEDPDGNGVEVLYNLPDDVWSGDVNAALNHFEVLPNEGDEALVDDTDYVKFAGSNS
jgi:catechol 2,3-dioxygenase